MTRPTCSPRSRHRIATSWTGPFHVSVDQRHRFVFSGIYQTGKRGSDFAGRIFSDWTFAPLIEFASGRPFNIITGNGDNLQLSSLRDDPTRLRMPAAEAHFGVPSKYSPSRVLQEVCPADFNGTLLSLDGNLGRNAGVSPWTVFDDLRVAKRIYFGERLNMDLIADMFNIANRTTSRPSVRCLPMRARLHPLMMHGSSSSR